MQTSKLPGKQTQAALSTEDGELQGETQLPHSTIKRELSFAEVQIFFISSLFLFFVISFFTVPFSLWNLSSLTRDQTCSPAVEVWSLNHKPPGKSQNHFFKNLFVFNWRIIALQYSTANLYLDIFPLRGLMSLTPALFRGQLYTLMD